MWYGGILEKAVITLQWRAEVETPWVGGGDRTPPQIRTQFSWGFRGVHPGGVRRDPLQKPVPCSPVRDMASYISIMICKSVCQRDSLKHFFPLLKTCHWLDHPCSPPVTLTSSRSLPFANTVPAVFVSKSSEVQVSLCTMLECYRNNRMSYCEIALILKMRGAFLASGSASVAVVVPSDRRWRLSTSDDARAG